MGLLPSVSTHVNHKHVLGLKRLLFSRALLPSAHKLFLLSMDVVIVDMLQVEKSDNMNVNNGLNSLKGWLTAISLFSL